MCMLAGTVPDPAAAILMKDDRLLMNLPQVEAAIQDSLRALDAIDVENWERFSALIGDDTDYTALMEQSCRSGHVAASYMCGRFIWPLRKDPWWFFPGT